MNKELVAALKRGLTEKDFDDKDWEVRLYAYQYLGFTKKAFTDTDWHIRLQAYEMLGFTSESLDDEVKDVREAATAVFFKTRTNGENR